MGGGPVPLLPSPSLPLSPSHLPLSVVGIPPAGPLQSGREPPHLPAYCAWELLFCSLP